MIVGIISDTHDRLPMIDEEVKLAATLVENQQ